MKKTRLNELAEETRRKENVSAKIKDDNTDAVRLTPEQLEDELAYIQQLKDEMRRIDEDLTGAEAKNRLYYLLGERTRCVCVCVHMEMYGGVLYTHGSCENVALCTHGACLLLYGIPWADEASIHILFPLAKMLQACPKRGNIAPQAAITPHHVVIGPPHAVITLHHAVITHQHVVVTPPQA